MQLTDSYVGTKVVGATTMTKNDFLTYIGKDNDPADDAPGFMVEYLDGGKPNHPLHKGYISWSPVDVFTKNYISIGDITGLEPHVVRLKAERAENFDRLTKLAGFISIQDKMADPDSGVTTTLPKVEPAQLALMKSQLHHMRALEDLFTQRLTLMIPSFGVQYEATIRIQLNNNTRIDLMPLLFEKLGFSNDYLQSYTGVVSGVVPTSVKLFDPQGVELTAARSQTKNGQRAIDIIGHANATGPEYHIVIDPQRGTFTVASQLEEVHDIEMTIQLTDYNRRLV